MSELTRLTDHSDAYLEYYHNTAQANDNVMRAMSKWYHMVELATERAIEELSLPDSNVYQMFPRGGAIPSQRPPEAR